jgi:undecaprenyl-diphosphatase
LVWWRGGPQWQQWSMLLFSAIFAVALGVQALKLLLRRSRPAGEWGAIYRKTDPHSFPSGHATRAALLLGLGYVLGPQWFANLMLLYSPAMALARIAMGVHYLSDVLAGYALGLLLAVALGRWFGAAGWLPVW